MGLVRPGIELRDGVPVLCAALVLAALFGLLFGTPFSGAGAAARGTPGFQGVASCAGTTCHGRLEADGAVVRQDELKLWKEPSSPGGALSRAFTVLSGTRARQITATLGLGDPTSAPACLGCHATPTGGQHVLTSDGVGCEACHGAAGGWIASHYTVGASHAANVTRGVAALARPA